MYVDEEAVERAEPVHVLYPQLNEFLADHAVLIRLISDGPLYAPSLCLLVCLSVCLCWLQLIINKCIGDDTKAVARQSPNGI